MKKTIGVAIMIAALTIGSITVYAAAGDTWNGQTAVCTHDADCTVHENCQDIADCDDSECPYGGNHCQDRDSSHNGDRHHDGTGHRHGHGCAKREGKRRH